MDFLTAALTIPTRGLSALGRQATRRLVKIPPTAALPHGRTIRLPGRGTTFVTDTGPREAPPLILLHSLATTGMLTWYPAVAELAKHYRVVIFDQRWHGQGIRSQDFNLNDCADDVVALADALRIDEFAAVGYSMGGVIAQLAWRRHPERVSALVLCATAATFHAGVRDRMAMAVLGRTMASTRELAVEHVSRHALTQLGAETSEMDDYRWALAEFRRTSAWAIGQALAALGRFDSTSWVSEINVPSAVVVPDGDRLIPPDHQRWLANRIGGAALYEFQGGHAACVMRATQFVPALAAAVASVSLRRAPDQ
ncbi:MAG: alpha/beta fold hydrolase [Sciscionella sp.]